MTEEMTPAPGSFEARDLGCTCPVFDNHYGRGFAGDGMVYGWIITEGCPVHAKPPTRGAVDLKTRLERVGIFLFVIAVWVVFMLAVFR